MNTELIQKLHLEIEPVGIFFGNTDAECDLIPDPSHKNCLVPLLMSAAKGKVIALDENNCNCPGGAVGCCFGDGFTRLNPDISKLLSQGYGDDLPAGRPEFMRDGERFYVCEELAEKWRHDFPYSDKAYPRTVFAPVSRWKDIGTPDIVYIFADPDQISALVILLGSHTGRAVNTIAPFGSACQSIAYAQKETDSNDPMAVMGLFDISQRYDALAGYLSMTLPYCLWENINYDLDKSCLTTHAWKIIEKRMTKEEK